VEGARLIGSSQISISFTVTKQSFPMDEAEYYLGDKYIGKTKYPVTTFSFIPGDDVFGAQTVSVRAYDQKRNLGEAKVNVVIIR
jgi:hypothetical protein